MQQRAALAAGIDTVIVVAFVAIGRRNHDEGGAISGLIQSAAPFLIALATAWVLLKIRGDRVWDRPLQVTTGVVVWSFTLVSGMLLRRFVFDDGTAFSFIVVASIFLALLVAWRAVAGLVSKRSDTTLLQH